MEKKASIFEQYMCHLEESLKVVLIAQSTQKLSVIIQLITFIIYFAIEYDSYNNDNNNNDDSGNGIGNNKQNYLLNTFYYFDIERIYIRIFGLLTTISVIILNKHINTFVSIGDNQFSIENNSKTKEPTENSNENSIVAISIPSQNKIAEHFYDDIMIKYAQEEEADNTKNININDESQAVYVNEKSDPSTAGTSSTKDTRSNHSVIAALF